VSAAQSHETTLVSEGCGPKSDFSGDVALSVDGRSVAFDCKSGRDPYEVFVADRATGQTTLVSRASGAFDEPANADSSGPSLSADGRFVAFSSRASNLTADDTDQTADVFVRDLASGTTALVSRASGEAGPKEDAGAYVSPSISADGRLVAFESKATNLSPDDQDDTVDVYVRDLGSSTTTLVSRASGIQGVKSNGTTFLASPSISSDGRFVAFQSDATNLSGAKRGPYRAIFVRDLAANTTALATRANGIHGAGLAGLSYDPVISANGRFVAFSFQPCGGLICSFRQNVYVRDLRLHRLILASRASGRHGAKSNFDGSVVPSISADGRRVAFTSDADNLTPGLQDTPFYDVFVRDLRSHTTILASRARRGHGANGNGDSGDASISGAGRLVAFPSTATDLAPNSPHGGIFVRKLDRTS